MHVMYTRACLDKLSDRSTDSQCTQTGVWLMLPFLWKQRQDTVWLSVVYHPAMCHQLLVMRIPLHFFARHLFRLSFIDNMRQLPILLLFNCWNLQSFWAFWCFLEFMCGCTVASVIHHLHLFSSIEFSWLHLKMPLTFFYLVNLQTALTAQIKEKCNVFLSFLSKILTGCGYVSTVSTAAMIFCRK